MASRFGALAGPLDAIACAGGQRAPNQFPPPTVQSSSGHTRRRRDCTLSSLFAAYAASCSSSDQLTAGRSDYLSWLGLTSQCSRQLRIVSSISCRTNDIRQPRPGPISWSWLARRFAMVSSSCEHSEALLVAARSRSQRFCLACSRLAHLSCAAQSYPLTWRGGRRGSWV
jgi:hypothetical protein